MGGARPPPPPPQQWCVLRGVGRSGCRAAGSLLPRSLRRRHGAVRPLPGAPAATAPRAAPPPGRPGLRQVTGSGEEAAGVEGAEGWTLRS